MKIIAAAFLLVGVVLLICLLALVPADQMGRGFIRIGTIAFIFGAMPGIGSGIKRWNPIASFLTFTVAFMALSVALTTLMWGPSTQPWTKVINIILMAAVLGAAPFAVGFCSGRLLVAFVNWFKDDSRPVQTTTQRLGAGYSALAAASIIHALVVQALWARLFIFDKGLPIPGKVWGALSLAWIVWPLVLLLHRERSILRVAVPVLIGAALLAPCVPILFSFTVWALHGFAP